MSCSKNHRDFYNKPKLTPDMIEKNKVYVWKEVMGNPNLYCWVPTSKKNVNVLDLNFEDVNMQDIPPVMDVPEYDDIIAQLAEQADDEKFKKLLQKIREDPQDKDLVSVDDPKKYAIVKEFIKRKKLKIYGGAAINMYLPKEDKIYSSTDIPDYDMFSDNPWEDAVELADIFYKNGYQYVEARSGIHKGTYKVFVNLWPVADISYIPTAQLEKIKTRKIQGLLIVSPIKLLESMYKEFSEPYANPGRWPKVAYREKLLTKWTRPFSRKFKCSKYLFAGGKIEIDPIIAELVEKSYKFIVKKKLLFSGPMAYNTYIELGGGSKRLVANHFRVLSENAHQDIQELMTLLMPIYQNLEITTQYYPSRELNNTSYSIHAVIDNKHHKICGIIHLNNCTPFQYVLGRYIVSIDYLKYDLYDIAVFGDNKTITNDAKCKLKYLNYIQAKYYKDKNISEVDKSPFQRFITTCRGPFQHNLKVEILNRWYQRLARKENVIRSYTHNTKIRIFPKEKIPPECKNLPKDKCNYPKCAWNNFIKRCTGLPTGIYRPGEDNEDLNHQFED